MLACTMAQDALRVNGRCLQGLTLSVGLFGGGEHRKKDAASDVAEATLWRLGGRRSDLSLGRVCHVVGSAANVSGESLRGCLLALVGGVGSHQSRGVELGSVHLYIRGRGHNAEVVYTWARGCTSIYFQLFDASRAWCGSCWWSVSSLEAWGLQSHARVLHDIR